IPSSKLAFGGLPLVPKFATDRIYRPRSDESAISSSAGVSQVRSPMMRELNVLKDCGVDGILKGQITLPHEAPDEGLRLWGERDGRAHMCIISGPKMKT